MAGIGIQLNRIFKKNYITASLYGIGCSVSYTIAPMLLVVGNLFLMFLVLDFDSVGYYTRELFSCSLLYIFIFALMFAAPLNSMISKYMADMIYEEKYEGIRPAVFLCLFITMGCAGIAGSIFYIFEYINGGVEPYYVFTSFMCFLALTLVFSVMIFNSVLKAYKEMSLFYLIGMAVTFILSVIFRFLVGFSITYSMLLALTIGFWLIAFMEMVNVFKVFRTNSYSYSTVLGYFKKYWKLIIANFTYTLGLFIHNFVFWNHPWNVKIADTYICNQPYDMATCVAMFTNISATVFFIVRTDTRFRVKYALYIKSVIGSKLDAIKTNKKRMMQSLSEQLMSLARLQFCVTVVCFMIFRIVGPSLGISSLTMTMYPVMAVAYYIAFLFYDNLLFLYYFDDLNGAAISGIIFALVTFGGSILAKELQPALYGVGFCIGAFAAYTYTYFRIRWVERHLDELIYCRGSVVEIGTGKKPSYCVYKRD